MADDSTAARDLLLDSFGRVHQGIPPTLEGLSAEDLAHRPGGTGNSIAWLLWHLARVEDDHVAGLTGGEQAWTAEGWHERSGLPFDPAAHGWGQTSQEGDACGDLPPASPPGSHEAVPARTEAYLSGIDAAELGRVVDTNWDPPVTVGVRLVSVLGDELQHLGQAGYIRGLLGHDEAAE